jgi:chromosome partitioning protein
MKSIVVLNNKGGVGKTTSVVNIASCFAKLNKSTVVVDLDPAASASIHLGFSKEEQNVETLCDYIVSGQKDIQNYIYNTNFSNLFCLPSEPSLSEFYDEMLLEQNSEFFLTKKVLPGNYDFILFDSPPNMGSLALNALAIADFVLIPVQTQYLALTGLELTLKSVSKVQRHLNPDLKILGYFATQYDRRTRVAKDVLQLLKDRFKNELFKTAIGVNSKLVEAFDARKPIIHKTPSARGALEYSLLSNEILKKIKKYEK